MGSGNWNVGDHNYMGDFEKGKSIDETLKSGVLVSLNHSDGREITFRYCYELKEGDKKAAESEEQWIKQAEKVNSCVKDFFTEALNQGLLNPLLDESASGKLTLNFSLLQDSLTKALTSNYKDLSYSNIEPPPIFTAEKTQAVAMKAAAFSPEIRTQTEQQAQAVEKRQEILNLLQDYQNLKPNTAAVAAAVADPETRENQSKIIKKIKTLLEELDNTSETIEIADLPLKLHVYQSVYSDIYPLPKLTELVDYLRENLKDYNHKDIESTYDILSNSKPSDEGTTYPEKEAIITSIYEEAAYAAAAYGQDEDDEFSQYDMPHYAAAAAAVPMTLEEFEEQYELLTRNLEIDRAAALASDFIDPDNNLSEDELLQAFKVEADNPFSDIAAIAQFEYGNRLLNIYDQEHPKTVDLSEVGEYLKKSAENGHLQAKIVYASIFCLKRGLDGEVPSLEDLQEAKLHFKSAAKEGYAYGMLEYADMLKKGEGTKDGRPSLGDLQEAKLHFKSAAKEGYAYGMLEYADMLKKGEGTKDGRPSLGDLQEAKLHFKSAAEKGYAYGMLEYANMLIEGEGTKDGQPSVKDLQEANLYFKELALYEDDSHADFRYCIEGAVRYVDMHFKDENPKYDKYDEQELSILLKAAINGSSLASYHLAKYCQKKINNKCMARRYYYQALNHHFYSDEGLSTEKLKDAQKQYDTLAGPMKSHWVKEQQIDSPPADFLTLNFESVSKALEKMSYDNTFILGGEIYEIEGVEIKDDSLYQKSGNVWFLEQLEKQGARGVAIEDLKSALAPLADITPPIFYLKKRSSEAKGGVHSPPSSYPTIGEPWTQGLALLHNNFREGLPESFQKTGDKTPKALRQVVVNNLLKESLYESLDSPYNKRLKELEAEDIIFKVDGDMLKSTGAGEIIQELQESRKALGLGEIIEELQILKVKVETIQTFIDRGWKVDELKRGYEDLSNYFEILKKDIKNQKLAKDKEQLNSLETLIQEHKQKLNEASDPNKQEVIQKELEEQFLAYRTLYDSIKTEEIDFAYLCKEFRLCHSNLISTKKMLAMADKNGDPESLKQQWLKYLDERKASLQAEIDFSIRLKEGFELQRVLEMYDKDNLDETERFIYEVQGDLENYFQEGPPIDSQHFVSSMLYKFRRID